jgi:NDP-sugar pyrophosphorylase family protein
MPMAGKGLRLSNAGFEKPKPLVEIKNKTIMKWSIDSLNLEGNFIFCTKQEHIDKYKIDLKLKQIIHDSKIVSISHDTRGTTDTILHARHLIDNNEELIITDADHFIEWDVEFFTENIRKQNIDGCTFVYPEPTKNENYSFVKLDDDGFVTESAEKKAISSTATVGLHYFKRGSDFVKYADEMIRRDISINNEFYVSPVFNIFVENNKKIITMPVKKMWPLGNKEEIDFFLKYYNSKN